MKKMRLDLERLAVESFATEREEPAGKGTVRAHESLYPTGPCDCSSAPSRCPTACQEASCMDVETCGPYICGGLGSIGTC